MANYTCPDGCPLYGAVEAAERPWREDAASAKHSKKWCIAGRVSPPGRGRVAGGGGRRRAAVGVQRPDTTAHNTEGHVLRFNPWQSGGRWFICMVTINASALWAGSVRSARPLFTGTLHHYARIRVVLCWARQFPDQLPGTPQQLLPMYVFPKNHKYVQTLHLCFLVWGSIVSFMVWLDWGIKTLG